MIMNARQSILFAHKEPWPQWISSGIPHPLYGQLMFIDVMPNVMTCQMHDQGAAPVFEILVRESLLGEPTYYWAWWNNQENEFEFVYGHRDLVNMCFPYGTTIEEKQGRGHLLPVIVEEIRRIT